MKQLFVLLIGPLRPEYFFGVDALTAFDFYLAEWMRCRSGTADGCCLTQLREFKK